MRAASAIVPVTTVPTGNVKLHQVSPNGSPRRSARTVSAVAMASHIIAKPHVGSPYSRANTFAPAGSAAASQNLTSSNRFAVVHLKMTSVGAWPQTPTSSSVSLSPYCLPEPM